MDHEQPHYPYLPPLPATLGPYRTCGCCGGRCYRDSERRWRCKRCATRGVALALSPSRRQIQRAAAAIRAAWPFSRFTESCEGE